MVTFIHFLCYKFLCCVLCWFLKVQIFGSILSYKLSLMHETVLNYIKTLKRYCEVILNVFFNEKFVDDYRKKYLYDRLFESN